MTLQAMPHEDSTDYANQSAVIAPAIPCRPFANVSGIFTALASPGLNRAAELLSEAILWGEGGHLS